MACTEDFTATVLRTIKRIPAGKVATYGQIALLAGNHRAARQVARLLHSSSAKHDLPWQRVVNGRGTISLRPGYGYEEQRDLLEDEGVEFGINDRIDLKRFLWNPKRT